MLTLRHTPLSLPAGPVWLGARLAHAPDVRGLVIIAHGSLEPEALARELAIAGRLAAAGFATLALELLTEYEDTRDPDLRYNTPLLANRIEAALAWLAHQPPLAHLPCGLLAGDTASGAAIRAASRNSQRLAAVYCCAGRIDMAGAGPLAALTVPVCIGIGQGDADEAICQRAFSHLKTDAHWHALPCEARSADLTRALADDAASWFEQRLEASQDDAPSD